MPFIIDKERIPAEAGTTSVDAKAVVIAWMHAWNSGDLEGVLELYDENVATESPLLLKLGQGGSPRLEGKAALRDYFARALAAAKHPVHMTPVNLLVEGDVAILEYERESPEGSKSRKPAVAERFVIRNGKIVESRVFWNADKIAEIFALKDQL